MAKSGREDREAVKPPDDPKGSDEEAIERAVRALQAGAGPEVFEPIFNRYYRSLFRFFANRPALREEADDLAQETLLRAFEKIETYGFESNFEAWLRRISENVWKNAVRKRRMPRRDAAVESLDAIDEEGGEGDGPRRTVFTDEMPTPEQQALTAEKTRVLLAALDELPQGMRRCTELRLAEDLKYQEIADMIGIGLSSVRSQLFEARKRLRPILDRYFTDADF